MERFPRTLIASWPAEGHHARAAGGWLQPFVNAGDGDRGLVTDGKLVIPRGYRPVALEAIDPALDRVPLAVVDLVERWRATSAGAALLAVADLVRLRRDGAADAASG